MGDSLQEQESLTKKTHWVKITILGEYGKRKKNKQTKLSQKKKRKEKREKTYSPNGQTWQREGNGWDFLKVFFTEKNQPHSPLHQKSI